MTQLPDYDTFNATADIFDAIPDRVRLCDLPWKHFGAEKRFAGPCTTILAREYPAVIQATLDEPGDHRVLFIDGSLVPDCACLGDILAKRALDNGWAGVVIAGAVRDSAAIARLPLGVVALRTTAKRPFDRQPNGERDVTLELGGTVIAPGDSIYVDDDAVIVI